MKKLLAILLFLLPISGYSGSSFLEKFGFHVLESVNISYLKYGTASPLDIAQEYGLPSKIERWETPDTREPGTDLRHEEWIWDGLRVRYTSVISTRKVPYKESGFWVEEIEVTDPRYVLFGGSKVGNKKKLFLDKISSQEIDNLRSLEDGLFSFDIHYWFKIPDHSVSAAGHVRVSIYLDDQERVKKVKWWYYAD